jgi:hypothetical protein
MSWTFWMLLACETVGDLLLVGLLGCMALVAACGFALCPARDEVPRDREEEFTGRWLRNLRNSFFGAIAFGMVLALVPERSTIVEAYAYSEASKIATGENAEKLVTETVKRIDKVTDALLEKMK